MVFKDDGGGAGSDGIGLGGEEAGGCVVGLLLLDGSKTVRFDDDGVGGESGLLGGKRGCGARWWWGVRDRVVFARFVMMAVGRAWHVTALFGAVVGT